MIGVNILIVVRTLAYLLIDTHRWVCGVLGVDVWATLQPLGTWWVPVPVPDIICRSLALPFTRYVRRVQGSFPLALAHLTFHACDRSILLTTKLKTCNRVGRWAEISHNRTQQ
jgi:hypothetical protein